MQKIGKIIVVTGRSGSGKDSVLEKVMAHEKIVSSGIAKVVTHASRKPREGEVHGRDHYFVTHEEMMAMHKSQEFVEEPVATGTTHKATSKKELLRVLKGETLIWRIEVSRAADVAGGQFFERTFSTEIAEVLKQSTTVILIDTDQATIEGRRMKRDGDSYDINEYTKRDEQEMKLYEVCKSKSHKIIPNPDGQQEVTTKSLVDTILAI
ncbi:hypothetical protein A2397_00380 [Candidatus Amesbacteria bacterium RIFOXYB1_FULL_44_23]|uniref:Guanylate kinase-like domain-containing protein n=1 Tax=Candidatus Amesbacteria bacterium RIFOXYB1_FULL_44_23 TaxID=1797263 RepID=A0A1F4ZUC1_9BACT|nr:MAG: hypothetical protein A2397_00380 [Candidatus Amesbacteria bacterium RIFOXYB1_FULL_44_23]